MYPTVDELNVRAGDQIFTVLESKTSSGCAREVTRAAMSTAIPRTSSATSSHSPVCSPARICSPISRVFLVSIGRTRVLAAVGRNAPDGVGYRDLGPPSVSGPNGFAVAFPALTDGGARVYESEEGKLRFALTTGSGCRGGKISYISQDRVGLNSAGSITVAGACSGTPALFLISNSHPTMLVGTGSGRADSKFVDLAMPRLFDDGSIMFSASTRRGGDGLYSIRPESGTANLSGPALLFASTSSAEPLHSILVVSVASNEHGRLAYLGGPIESLASQN